MEPWKYHLNIFYLYGITTVPLRIKETGVITLLTAVAKTLCFLYFNGEYQHDIIRKYTKVLFSE